MWASPGSKNRPSLPVQLCPNWLSLFVVGVTFWKCYFLVTANLFSDPAYPRNTDLRHPFVNENLRVRPLPWEGSTTDPGTVPRGPLAIPAADPSPGYNVHSAVKSTAPGGGFPRRRYLPSSARNTSRGNPRALQNRLRSSGQVRRAMNRFSRGTAHHTTRNARPKASTS